MDTSARPHPSLSEIAREWGRIGLIGFGGPPAHIALLRELCVERRGWLSGEQFEHAIAATNITPGPASTQLSIYCAWVLRGRAGALVGGLCFICPGLIMIVALAALFLSGHPPLWVRGAGLGAGAAVAPVALRAGIDVWRPIARGAHGERRLRVVLYALAGALASIFAGGLLVIVLLACGALEILAASGTRLGTLAAASLTGSPRRGLAAIAAIAAQGGTAPLAWTALKVGALSFGGGFVIIPLMQADAVQTYHWMTHEQFLNAVALGQITPGPLVQTVAVIGYAAGGVPAALFAAVVAFSPSFAIILAGAPRFERLLASRRALTFLRGAAPATAGAIIGACVPLASSLSVHWQYALLVAAAGSLLVLRRGIPLTLLAAACVGTVAALAGAPAPI